MITKIAITGPESTGKTQLAEQLAAHYRTVWIPEFARDYLFNLGRNYTYNDILYIARNQFSLIQQEVSTANRFLFSDTELIVTKIWCKVKYGKSHDWIEEHIGKQGFDLYLLAGIDLPWEPDPQREHPHMREELMQQYVNELKNQNFPYRIITGIGDERLKNAIKTVNTFFNIQS
jgi:NadR type nicotinamide-nucleotide adenylyltransferase